MSRTLLAREISQTNLRDVGGKALCLSRLQKNGIKIPESLCVTADVYRAYVSQTGLSERIALELNRKAFKQMRWEEIWDCATRIRNLFLHKSIPPAIEAELRTAIDPLFSDRPVVVRSSAPDEDGKSASFAGLHESFVNVRGIGSILKHIRLVWASLWSDAALLYRQEIGLEVEKSAMAVVVQELVAGDRSGVVFTRNPTAFSQGIVESVHGLNQGLVDGLVEPDRWILDRRARTILSHTPARREVWLVPGEKGVHKENLASDTAHRPPLGRADVKSVFDIAMRTEAIFGAPQDVEWTSRGNEFYILQARPITTLKSDADTDSRSWYLSLHRTFDNLKTLRRRIEGEFIPAMIREADRLSQLKLEELSDRELAREIHRRLEINQKWVNIYWEEFIPFAHGIRLFGQFYNDAVAPEDPYEFIDLLTETQMVSVRRNRMLEDMADLIRSDPNLAERLEQRKPVEKTSAFNRKVDRFIREFGDLSCSVTGGTQCLQEKDTLLTILLEMAAHPPAATYRRRPPRPTDSTKDFLGRFPKEKRTQAAEMLDLARASYQLRDDDNIYLGRIESHLLAAIQTARRRLSAVKAAGRVTASSQILAEAIADLDQPAALKRAQDPQCDGHPGLKARQIVGQPAGPGMATGNARVIREHADLSDFRYGEVMVCDAVDPNMTFVVPLAAAVVERRGGMLIHGAIIAREYGLPCVTGVPDAVAMIRTGDQVTVDGYLGIVTVGAGEFGSARDKDLSS